MVPRPTGSLTRVFEDSLQTGRKIRKPAAPRPPAAANLQVIARALGVRRVETAVLQFAVPATRRDVQELLDLTSTSVRAYARSAMNPASNMGRRFGKAARESSSMAVFLITPAPISRPLGNSVSATAPTCEPWLRSAWVAVSTGGKASGWLKWYQRSFGHCSPAR